MFRLLPRLCALLLVAGLGLQAQAQAQPAAPAAVPVGTAFAQRKAIDQALDFVGRVEAVGRVEVRARVVGFLDAVQFKEGEPIKEGAPLYRIEPDLFEAAVKQAEGALERTRAAELLAAIQLQRAQDLLDKSSGTVVARDQARAARDQAKGAVMGDEASLQTARINLGYTQIFAPISGQIGRTSVTKGNVVGPDSGALTTIVSQDPIYVTFPVSQREFLRYQQGGARPDRSKIGVRIRFQDGSEYGQVGRVDFVNISVDRATDTVVVRATMPNPAGALRDGQLVRVNLQAGQPEQKIVVPQSALIADQGGVYVFVVEESRAKIRRVKPEPGGTGTDAVIAEGLSGGEVVIVDGLQRVRPGILVQATPVSETASRI
ncbi:efflux RND transporter periplasmic adaptor subunit [Methylorubrum extorquens]|uniref:efflux RND transporter periplasmic adaptor subunit n=1 Tax=Methylorubrum extorquens TaxID=408 RepID=UPI000158F1BC|nr:efflux RND transporter periplasmic adaptor subunit [Methylorubrum extorquens]ABY29544.1 efflux transporter, RND family, MFP subunit [Methylorubrum extorquens PA1]KQP88847.1 RND transporter MFP subunit [Methylobacterium sp. Leaf119]WIU40869.1 efflux RND transporter periplasmic adaptor subunit [Methylorubrum extorquens]